MHAYKDVHISLETSETVPRILSEHIKYADKQKTNQKCKEASDWGWRKVINTSTEPMVEYKNIPGLPEVADF